MIRLKKLLFLIKDVFLDFLKDLPLIHGSAIAYYTILAMVPLLYLVFQFFGLFLGDDFIKSVLYTFLNKEIGITEVDDIMNMLSGVDLSRQSLPLKVAGGLMIAFSCTAIISVLKTSINTFFGIKDRPKTPRKMILSELLFRLFALLAIIFIVLLVIVVYFAETVILSLSNNVLADMAVVNWFVIEISKHGLPIVTNLFVLLFMFKFLHDGKVSWKIALKGALFTGILLYLGQLGLKLYLTTYFFASVIGVAGSILMILVWVFYSALMMLLGAKFTAAYARSKGEKIQRD
jgi:membrane protein